MNDSQEQTVAGGSVGIQVDGSTKEVVVHNTTHNQTNNYGLTAEEVRAVAKDSFRADFVQLLGQAGDIAEARANRVVERYLERLEKENPGGINQANNPDFRYALFSAQKAQARSDDNNLGELLVELLIERTREQERNLQQVVLNEALEVVARLTDGQVAALTVIFALRMCRATGFLFFEHWLQWMDTNVQPFVEKAKISDASFSHLAFTGCGALEMGEITIADILLRTYPSIWQAGFTFDDPVYQQLPQIAKSLTRPSVHTPGRFEVLDGPIDNIVQFREQVLPNPEERSLIDQLLSRPRLSHDQIKERCIAMRPYMTTLFDLWDKTSAKRFMPTSVGVAIAHANIIRVNPQFGPLSTWVN